MAVIYCKLSPYIVSYLRVKFLGEPIKIPKTNYLYSYLLLAIAPNAYIKRTINAVDKTMKSDVVSTGVFADDGTADYVFVPSEEERDEYVAIELPDQVPFGGKLVTPNNTWYFLQKGGQQFRDEIRNLFWSDLELMVHDFKKHCSIQRIPFNYEMGVEQFMVKFNIDLEHRETLVRNRKRKIKKSNLASSSLF